MIKYVLDPIENGGSSYCFGKPVRIKDFVRKITEYKTVYEKIEYGVLNPEERKKLKKETEVDLLRILGKNSFVVEGIS